MIDLNLLKNFCAEPDRDKRMSEPFSYREFTYATNGHVAVRVPIIGGAKFGILGFNPDPEPLFIDAHKNADFDLSHDLCLPPVEIRVLDCKCNGEELVVHDCPSCDCQTECDKCDGSGKIRFMESSPVKIGHHFFDAFYLKLLERLQSVRFSKNSEYGKPMAFVFDGGQGIIMSLVGDFKTQRPLK